MSLSLYNSKHLTTSIGEGNIKMISFVKYGNIIIVGSVFQDVSNAIPLLHVFLDGKWTTKSNCRLNKWK